MNAIELRQVCVSFHGQSILQNVNFSIASGELIGIFGPNGGGKTTILKLLLGFLTPDRGSVRIFQEIPEKIRQRIGYVPQIHRTDPDFPITVAELIMMGLLSKRSLFGGYCKKEKEHCDFWLDRLGLTAHRDKAYGELSGGLAQRALLARALISDPDLILLDEPTANIDAASLSIFWQTLENLKGKKTILLVTHDLKMAVSSATKLLLVQGKVTTYMPDEICEHFNMGIYHSRLINPQLVGITR